VNKYPIDRAIESGIAALNIYVTSYEKLDATKRRWERIFKN